MSFILIKTLKNNKTAPFISDRLARIPIGIMDFQSEIHSSDLNYFFFLTFNYKKVPIKIKILQSSPLKPNQTFKTHN